MTEACTYIFGDGSGTHSDPRIRRVGWSAVIIQGMSNCLGQTLDIWKRHSERLMNSLKPAGGWMGTLGEGEPNTEGGAELMACVVAAESTRGNVVYVTDYQILKKRQDRGWPVPRLGQGAGAGGIHSNWVENCASVAFSGPIPRNHVVLELCGMDIAIFVHVECAMFGSHQVVGTGCAEQNQAGIPASCQNELAVTSDGN